MCTHHFRPEGMTLFGQFTSVQELLSYPPCTGPYETGILVTYKMTFSGLNS